jgi:hypothetical protein
MQNHDDTLDYTTPRPQRNTERHYGITALIASALGLLSALAAAALSYFRIQLPSALFITLMFIFTAIGIYGGLMGFYALLAGIFDPHERKRAILGIFAILMTIAEFIILIITMAIGR